jgi:multiple sugar transport system substrate-binding protein
LAERVTVAEFGPAGIGSDVASRFTRQRIPVPSDFLRWFHSEKIYEQWWVTQQGFSVGPTKIWENHKLWQEDPIMLPFRTAAESGRFAGYAGPATRKAAEVISKYIISDMYAKAVQGMAPEDAVKWAHGELVKIYA